jgi:hypothetical protein
MHFWMCCIQPMMHSCALFCIPEHYGGTIPDLDVRRAARSYSHHMRQYAQECVRMRKNTLECTELWDHTSKEKYASECTRMHKDETECVGMHRTVEPHILTQEKPSGLKAKLTCGRNGYGLDGLWACHKACPWSTHVPLHVIQVFIRLLSVP